jgi:hypothetical protein
MYKDLSVGVGGLPMQVLRTYDSFDKSVGDFGVGWRVELSNFHVSTGRPLGLGGWTQYNVQCVFGLCLTGFKTAIPHVAMVTWPDGHHEEFGFTPDGGSNIFWTGTAKFTPRARATSKLAVDGSSDISCRHITNAARGAGQRTSAHGARSSGGTSTQAAAVISSSGRAPRSDFDRRSVGRQASAAEGPPKTGMAPA